MKSIWSDPIANQLAGLAVMNGANPAEAMSKALTQSAQIQQQQYAQQEAIRQQQVQSMLPQLLSKVDFSSPQKAFQQLLPILGPEQTSAILKQVMSMQQMSNETAFVNGMSGGAPTGAPGIAPSQPQSQLPMSDPTTQVIPPVGISGALPPQQPSQGASFLSNKSIPELQKALATFGKNEGIKAAIENEIKSRDSAKDDVKQDYVKNRDMEYKIAGDFDTASKPFMGVRDGYANVKTAAQDNSPLGDIQLLYGFMKTQDPTSTVRESELATAQNAAGIPEQIRSLYNKALNGDRLSPERRQEFVRLGEKNYKVAEKQHNKTAQEYKKRAEKFGLNPDNVIADYGITTDEAPTIQLSREDALAELRRRGRIK